ncbi:hypothetical protein [Streptomyces sp. NPDC048349]|uniref:DUF732 domain-containing protein n=1 Tax=Streptomyces sp. NPDC048349 TaxID=3155486 RepID=UPI0034475799
MHRHHTATALLAVAAALALTACSSDSSDPKPDTAAPTNSSAPAAPSDTTPTAASPSNDTGIPPEPGPQQRTIYLAALNGIDPEIVNGKEDKAVSRGRDQCAAMKDEKDPTKRVAQVEKRFIGPNHPDGFGPTKSALILAAVQANICPTY